MQVSPFHNADLFMKATAPARLLAIVVGLVPAALALNFCWLAALAPALWQLSSQIAFILARGSHCQRLYMSTATMDGSFTIRSSRKIAPRHVEWHMGRVDDPCGQGGPSCMAFVARRQIRHFVGAS